MAYYLSRKNKKLLEPFLKLLEVSKDSLTFNVSNPPAFQVLLRSAFAISHPHLRDIFRLRIRANAVVCERIDVQLSIDNIVLEPVNLYRIADAIISDSIPVKFLNADIPEEDVSSLSSLAQSKSFRLIFKRPVLEITYE